MTPVSKTTLFRRLSLDGAGLLVLVLIVTGWCASRELSAFNEPFYDLMLRLSERPPASDILIVTIDDRSLAELGRWPWDREVHGRLLERLHDARAVLLDILLVEPGAARGDDSLARAMADQGRVFVPVFRSSVSAPGQPPAFTYPVPVIRDAAAGMGHINAEADTDGEIRHVSLREWDGERWWPHLAWRVYASLRGEAVSDMPGEAVSEGGPALRDHVVRIPFRGPRGHYPEVPYASVLKGQVPDDLLKDRIVLVGATAPGLGDRYAVPVSGRWGSMAGVEIQAHLLDGLLSGYVIKDLAVPWRIAVSLLPVMLLAGVVVLTRLERVHGPLLAILVLIPVASWAGLGVGVWWPPMASLLGVLMLYLLWSWRSSAVTLSWFSQQIGRLDLEPHPLPVPRQGAPVRWGSRTHRQIALLEGGLNRLRASSRFINDVLESLPVITILVDDAGRVLIANGRARQCLPLSPHPRKILLRAALRELCALEGCPPCLTDPERGGDISRWHQETLVDREGRHFRLEVVRYAAETARVRGWLVSLVDMTGERRAAEQRAHMLRFLSHDMKAPQASVMALLDLQSSPAALPEGEFLSRLRRQMGLALQMTEDFMQLAKVEFGALRFQEVLLAHIVLDALDRAWPLARSKSISLQTGALDDDKAVMHGDPSYLERALFNLLDNAIKYSPPGAAVMVSVWYESARVFCRVSDQGVGIPAHWVPRIFEFYQRFDSANMAGGVGLGLAFVKTVVDKHHGDIECHSEEGRGATFTLRFPAVQAPAAPSSKEAGSPSGS